MLFPILINGRTGVLAGCGMTIVNNAQSQFLRASAKGVFKLSLVSLPFIELCYKNSFPVGALKKIEP